MKKPVTVVFTMLLACTLAFAQTGGDKSKELNPQPLPPRKTPNVTANTYSGKKATKTSKTHKGGKTSKTPAPAASPAPTPAPAK